MAVADGAILRIVASLIFPESVIAQNVFYAVFADTGGSDAEEDVLTDLATYIEAVYTTMTARVDDIISVTGIKVYNYDALDDDWDEVGDEVLNYDFEGSGDMCAHGVAGLVHAKTTDPDVQAAKYIGGILDAQMIEGTWVTGTVEDMADFAAEWSTPFVGIASGADFAPGVWSVVNKNFFLFSGVEVVNVIPAYQRRRKPGVGI
jgi:hypothetical protein